MTHRHAVFVVCLVLAVLASPTIVAQETPTQTETANTTTESADTAGMGAQMTAFLQSSSSAANDSVENGMWEARFNQSNASERARLVTNRTGSLEQRLERLRAQNETIQQRYENGTLNEQAYIARQSQLNARIDALQTAVNDTDEAAAQAGVNDSRLERLKGNASQLRGQQVAGIARGLGAGPPDHAGPPADRGPSGDRATGPPTDRGGPAGPATNTTSNSTSDGPGAAPGNGGGGGGGPGTSGGSGGNSGNSGGGGSGNSGGGGGGNSGNSGGGGGGSGGGGPP